MSKVYGIILAGGTGSRMGVDTPKQFLRIKGKPVIVFTLEKFQDNASVDGIIVVIHKDYIDRVEKLIEEYNIRKIIDVIPGGETRQGSSYNALTGHTYDDDDILLFHDAVRPFISDEIIQLSINETKIHNAVDVCVKTTDTIVKSQADGQIESMPDRNNLRNGQTPQAFKYKIIRDAHEYAMKSNFKETTDDVRLVLNNGQDVKIINGSYENIKITTANDMILAEAISANQRKIKIFSNEKISLIQPGKFEKILEEKELFKEDTVVVKPIVTSICQADLRYYLGNRKPEVLEKKLPMALLHEGVGIVEDANGNPEFKNGDRVIVIPNIPGCVYDPKRYNTFSEACSFCGGDYLYENHCKYTRFLSSGYDGLAQKYLFHPSKCLLKLTDDIPDDIATMSELLTVSYNAVKRIAPKRNSDIMIFGDGPVGFMTALILHKVLNFPGEQIHVVGIDQLNYFDFVKTYHFDEVDNINVNPDNIFECVGGKASEGVVNKSIEIINPVGTIVLMGVSEENIKINTRDVLEKGISILGSSRSSRYDYLDIFNHLKDPELQRILRKVIIEEKFKISSSEDLNKAFSYTADKKEWGKILLEMNL